MVIDVRRIALLSTVFLALNVAPAVAAPRTYTVGADVKGAVTTHFTLKRKVVFPLNMSVTQPSDLYGMILTRVDDKTGFIVGMNVAPAGPRAFVGVGSVSEHGGLVWDPGTYDLTLFSPTRTRVNLKFETPMPRLQFHARTLQLTERGTTSNQPAWYDQVDLTITGATRGLVVAERDEWTGMDRHMQRSCAWHIAPCLPVDESQLTEGKNDSGPQSAESLTATRGTVFGEGSNHVSLASITGGPATRRVAVVLVVP